MEECFDFNRLAKPSIVSVYATSRHFTIDPLQNGNESMNCAHENENKRHCGKKSIEIHGNPARITRRPFIMVSRKRSLPVKSKCFLKIVPQAIIKNWMRWTSPQLPIRPINNVQTLRIINASMCGWAIKYSHHQQCNLVNDYFQMENWQTKNVSFFCDTIKTSLSLVEMTMTTEKKSMNFACNLNIRLETNSLSKTQTNYCWWMLSKRERNPITMLFTASSVFLYRLASLLRMPNWPAFSRYVYLLLNACMLGSIVEWLVFIFSVIPFSMFWCRIWN